MKQQLFFPGEISIRHNCYDRIEPLVPYENNPVLKPDKPWEGNGVAYPAVLYIKEENLYKCWYMSVAEEKKPTGVGVLIDNADISSNVVFICFAVSVDGINWEKPKLNIILPDKYPENNIIYRGLGRACGCPSVLYEPQDKNPEHKYKFMIYDYDDKGNDGILLMTSPDGIHWKQFGPHPVLPSQDTPSLWKDPKTGRYTAYLKDRVSGRRSRLVSYSDDFINWSEPVICIVPDISDSEITNYYSQAVFSDFGHDMSIVSVFDLATQTTAMELFAVYGGNCMKLPTRPTILRGGRGKEWDAGGIYNGNSEPVAINGKKYFYYGGIDLRHDEYGAGYDPVECIGMALFEPGRLAGQQFEDEGYFISLPILCPGGNLYINADTGLNELSVEIHGTGYSGILRPYSQGECIPVKGNDTMLPVKWKNGDSLDRLKGKYIKLKVSGKNARVYGVTFN
jgi:hypothetical protein